MNFKVNGWSLKSVYYDFSAIFFVLFKLEKGLIILVYIKKYSFNSIRNNKRYNESQQMKKFCFRRNMKKTLRMLLIVMNSIKFVITPLFGLQSIRKLFTFYSTDYIMLIWLLFDRHHIAFLT